jgi:tRNA dimethylallyltransferase
MVDLRPILIAGPTASGKSALALQIARETGGVIINADSMQVYAELPILSARPAPEEEAQVPHRLYGHVPMGDGYSVGRFVREAEQVKEQVQAEGLRPIFVGGTGLYFKALLEGLSPIPAIPPAIREHWRREADRIGPSKLHRLLAERDPVTASRLSPTDPQRIVRALEVLEATDRPLWDWQNEPGRPVLRAQETVRLAVCPERATLHQCSETRFDGMMAQGALAEAERIAGLNLDPALPGMRALGLRPLMAHLQGDLSLEDAVAEGKAETRRYIKRQATWINGNMRAWKRISEQEMKSLAGKIVTFINCLP